MTRSPAHRRLLATTFAAGALAVAHLAAAPQAGAAAPPTAASCVTGSDSQSFGRGEISVCVGDGEARVTGWVEDLLPGSGWGAPDGYCASWFITWRTASGQESWVGPTVCGHFGTSDRYDFDFDEVTRPGGPQDITGVVDVGLGATSI